MVTQRGIKVNLDQIKAIASALALKNKKDLQHLIDKLVMLGRFIARFKDKLRRVFLALREANAMGWTKSCQNAFEGIKHYLAQPFILSSPQPGERFYLYLAVSN